MYRVKLCVLLLAISSFVISTAQEGVNSTGGEASGAGGKVSYTIGQVFYSPISSAEGSLSPGVQQSYKIDVTSVIEGAESINLTMDIYPNPTDEILSISVEDFHNENLYFQLFDVSGKLVLEDKISSQLQRISLKLLDSGSYFLKFTDGTQTVKTFSIIKN